MSRLLPLPTLAAALGSLAVAGGALASYAANIEPHWPEIVRLELPLARLPRGLDGLTIAQLSDIHAGHFTGPAKIRRYVEMVHALRPDIVAITGDMFHAGAVSAWMCAAELSALTAALGVYVVPGNHERHVPPEVGELPFRRAGLTMLANTAQRVQTDDGALWMVGVDDMIMRRGNLQQALQGVPDEACKVLLVHEPDLADQASRYPIDLQLSGHTHGGQIRVPGLGALLLPVMGRRYPMGLYKVDGMWVYTNRGLGVNRPALRFNCRPEITLFTLRPYRVGAKALVAGDGSRLRRHETWSRRYAGGCWPALTWRKR